MTSKLRWTQITITAIVFLVIVCISLISNIATDYKKPTRDTTLVKQVDSLRLIVSRLQGYKIQVDSLNLRLDSLFAYNKLKDSVFTYQNLWIREADEAFPWLDQQIKEDLKPAIPMRRK